MMTNNNQVLSRIVDSEEPLELKQVLDLILPPKNEPYNWQEVDQLLQNFNDEVEQVQRLNNDKFDEILDQQVQEKLKNLCSELSRTQMDVIKLHNCIAQAKEQFSTVETVCNGPLVQDRRQLIEEEKHLRHSLKQSKFRPVIDYFRRFSAHLEASVTNFKQLLTSNATKYTQNFDWAIYHQVMFLLRACGKTMIELDKFERLYQSCSDMFAGLELKQPLDKMDLNNFIEFQTTYSLESQLDVVLESSPNPACNSRLDFQQFSMNPEVVSILNSCNAIDYNLLRADMEKLGTITIDCCRLLIDLNLNYIEAHFTDGIYVDKLNGCDSTTAAPGTDQQVLPCYAFSPQEYSTQIGQHLLTLRKQTEQYDQIDARPLKMALEYLRHAQTSQMDIRLCSSVTEIILKCIAKHCIRSLLGRTTNSILSKLTPNGRRQLATDAMYLDNVLEDLNLLDPCDLQVEKFKSLFAQ